MSLCIKVNLKIINCNTVPMYSKNCSEGIWKNSLMLNVIMYCIEWRTPNNLIFRLILCGLAGLLSLFLSKLGA